MRIRLSAALAWELAFLMMAQQGQQGQQGDRGEIGHRGDRGEEGKQGPRGNQGNDGRFISWSTTKGFIIASVIFAILLYALLFQSVTHERQGCERLDQVRSVEYDVLSDAIPSLHAQVKAARERGQSDEATAITERLGQYRGYLEDLAVPENFLADNPVNPADIDCSKAYPGPAPF